MQTQLRYIQRNYLLILAVCHVKGPRESSSQWLCEAFRGICETAMWHGCFLSSQLKLWRQIRMKAASEVSKRASQLRAHSSQHCLPLRRSMLAICLRHILWPSSHFYAPASDMGLVQIFSKFCYSIANGNELNMRPEHFAGHICLAGSEFLTAALVIRKFRSAASGKYCQDKGTST